MTKSPKHIKNRLLISSIGVDAPIIHKAAGDNGILQDPDTPDDIVYHDLSKWPKLGGKIGEKGNAIFTGHVDSGFQYCKYGTVPPPCYAVLWDLDKVKKNEIIDIYYENNIYQYETVSNNKITKNKFLWLKNILKTKDETITIISCTGEFIPETHSYKSLQIVKAKRIQK